MTVDEEVRQVSIALADTSLVFRALGVHLNPLDAVGGSGTI
ncbi:MAG: hypothetical protein ABSF83_13035 [Nitrososphaerales archaeon]